MASFPHYNLQRALSSAIALLWLFPNVMTLTMGQGLDRRPHAYQSGASPGQGAQTSIGLASIWTFDDLTSRDWLGTNNLTATGTLATGTGKIGACASFVSSSPLQLLSIPTPATQLVLNSPNTHALWFKPVSNVDPSGQPTILSNGKELRIVLNPAPDFGLNAFTIECIVSLSNYDSIGGFLFPGVDFLNGVSVGSARVYYVGDWLFIGVSIDPVQRRAIICVNNQFNYADLSAFPIPVDTTFCLGAASDVTQPFRGLVDEVAFWRRALSVNDFLFLYNNGTGRRYQWDSGRFQVLSHEDVWFYGPDGKYIVPN